MENSIADIIIQAINPIVSILGILVTTLVSIVAIRKTADANRISTIHSEMLQCIIESIGSIKKMRNLLDGISRKAKYFCLPENKFIETAYTRYWRQVQTISQEFNINQSKQKFLLPKKLYDKMQQLIGKINEARNEAKNLEPDENNIYPDTGILKSIVKEINSLYVDFVHEARVYVGTDALPRFNIRKEHILGVEEAEEKDNS